MYIYYCIILELIANCEGESVEATIIILCDLANSNIITSIEYETVKLIRNTYRDREEC